MEGPPLGGPLFFRCVADANGGAIMPTIKIFSSGAMRPLMTEAIPLFERASGVRIEIEFRLTSVLKKAIEDGALCDVAVLPRPELDDLVEQGAIASGSTADASRSAVGLAARAGAPKPDIGSTDALRRVLLRARSFAYSDGPSGAYTAALLEKLGIAEQMRPKTRLTSGPVAELVASGEAEIGVQQIVAILAPNWSAHCPANCKMSLSMPRASHPAPAMPPWREPSSRLWGPTKRGASFVRTAWSQARPRLLHGLANRRKRLRHRAFIPISA
jgi:molybdate transport system substrate-binding protein